MQTLQLGNSLLLSGVAIGNAIGIVTNPLFGALSDRIGRRPLLGASYFLAALYVLLLFFPLLRTGDAGVGRCWRWRSRARCCSRCRWRSAAASIRSGSPIRRLRLSGVSLGRQLGTILGGGLMPMIAASLLAMVRRLADVGARLLRARLRAGRRGGRVGARDLGNLTRAAGDDLRRSVWSNVIP